jgi:hypothetical protein
MTGQLTIGQPMFFEAKTPTIPNLLIFQAVMFCLMSICILIRAKVGKKYDFKFLQPKHT